MLNSFDPNQDQCFVGPDLGPNYLQRLSADCTDTQIVKGVTFVLNKEKHVH